jgi:hypothetical protein
LEGNLLNPTSGYGYTPPQCETILLRSPEKDGFLGQREAKSENRSHFECTNPKYEVNAVRNAVKEANVPRVPHVHCLIAGLVLLLLPGLANAQAFVQAVDSGKAPTQSNSVTVSFTSGQSTNNLNVVVVGWSDTTSSVLSVGDSNGNTYALAAGTNAGSDVSQEIFYAVITKGGASVATPNTITVTFRTNASFPDVRALEYSGVSTATPLNVSGGAGGPGTSADSGSVAQNASASTSFLVVGGGSTDNSFASATPPFKNEDTANLNGNIAGEVNPNPATGPFDVKATLPIGSNWVLQLAAFGNAATTMTAPTIGAGAVSPATGPDSGNTGVTISGNNFAPGAIVLFGAAGTPPTGISGVNCSVASLTTITCTTPADNVGPKDVSVINPDGQFATSTGAFTYKAVTPSITSITPDTDFTNGGTGITISGNSFVSPVTVTFDGVTVAADIPAASSTTINLTSPAHAVGSANVVVENTSESSSSAPSTFNYSAGSGPINFVQSADSGTAKNPASNAVVTMPLSETAGDLNVVVIGWSDTANHTITVADSEGNTYTQALNPTIGSATGQVIYYAKNIKGGPSNTIIVTVSPAAAFVDVRAAEYSGLDANNPLDKASGNSGTNGTASSGPITVGANELVIGAGTTDGAFTAAGTGFATVDITTNGNDLEHQVAPPAGPVNAQASLAGNWAMQAVSFLHGAPVPDFAFSPTPSPASNTVNAGSSASYTISVSGLNGFTSAVSLSCSAGLPAGASCGFSPPSVTPGGAPATSTLTITTTVATPGGTSTVTITGKSGTTSHTASVSLVVNGSTSPGFSMQASALSPASVSPGGSATSTITLTGANGFNVSSVSLSCSSITGGGSPAPTCSFGAISGGSSTLTVSTTGNTATGSLRSTGVFYAMLLPIGGITLLGAGFTSRRKKLLGMLLICLVISGLGFMVACGGGSSSGGGGGGGGTPAGTYSIKVQGSATGVATQTQTLTLTVQ